MSAAPARHPRPIAPRAANAPTSAGSRSATAHNATATKPAPARRTQPQRRPAGAVHAGSTGHLRAVAAPEQARSLVPFAWTCALIIIGSLSAVLLVNTSMAKGAYERRDIKVEIAHIHEQRSVLVTQLEEKSSPDQLGADAQGLGMQPARQFGFISLSDNIVIESGGK